MGIYIKGMEMPESGYVDVRLHTYAGGRKCATTQTGEHPFYKEMAVVEVPTPHGDLIDRKAYWDETNKYEWKSIEDVLSCAFTLVVQAPTIIAAEE